MTSPNTIRKITYPLRGCNGITMESLWMVNKTGRRHSTHYMALLPITLVDTTNFQTLVSDAQTLCLVIAYRFVVSSLYTPH
jgi:hypothetical protein